MARLLHDLLFHSARGTPAREALVMGARSMTYGETADAAARFAAVLIEAGTGRNERVAFYAEKRFETATTLFGTSRAGAVFVPINPMLKAEQVRHILEDCDLQIR